MGLTRNELDRMTCATPGCDHTAHDGLFFHPACHPDSPTWVEYQPMIGVLRIICAECELLLAEVAVK